MWVEGDVMKYLEEFCQALSGVYRNILNTSSLSASINSFLPLFKQGMRNSTFHKALVEKENIFTLINKKWTMTKVKRSA